MRVSSNSQKPPMALCWSNTIWIQGVYLSISLRSMEWTKLHLGKYAMWTQYKPKWYRPEKPSVLSVMRSWFHLVIAMLKQDSEKQTNTVLGDHFCVSYHCMFQCEDFHYYSLKAKSKALWTVEQLHRVCNVLTNVISLCYDCDTPRKLWEVCLSCLKHS